MFVMFDTRCCWGECNELGESRLVFSDGANGLVCRMHASLATEWFTFVDSLPVAPKPEPRVA